MKKALCLLLALTTAIALIGCSGKNATDAKTSTAESAETTTNYADKDFVADVQNALETRWDSTDKMDVDSVDYESADFVNAITKLTNQESKTLSKYKTANFKDGELQELAIKYLNNLNKSKTIAKKFPSDYINAYDEWEAMYNDRTTIIQTLINKYGLTFSDKYADDVAEITANAKSVASKDKEKEKVDKLAKSLKFNKKGDGTGYYTYTTKVKNNTGLNFEYLTFNIDLLDKDGTVIEQENIYFENVEDGKSYQGDFETDAKFENYKITADYTVKS